MSSSSIIPHFSPNFTDAYVINIANIVSLQPFNAKILKWFHSLFSSPPLHNCRRYLIERLPCTNVRKNNVKCYCFQWHLIWFESNWYIDCGALDFCNIWYKLYKTCPLSAIIHLIHQRWVTGSTKMYHRSKPTLAVSHTVDDIFFYFSLFSLKHTRIKKTNYFLPLISCILYIWLKNPVKHLYLKALILNSSKHFHSKGPVSVIYYFHKL